MERNRRDGRLVGARVTVGVVLAALVVVAALRLTAHRPPGAQEGYELFTAVLVTGLGYAVVRRASDHPVGWLLLVGGTAAALAAVGSAVGPHPLGQWLHAWALWPAYSVLPVVLLLFPDGRLPSPRWRAGAWCGAAGLIVPTVTLAVASAVQPDLLVDLDRPLPAEVQGLLVATAAGVVLSVVTLLLAVASLFARWHRADGLQRQQLRWLAFGACVTAGGLALDTAALPGAWVPAALAVPVTATVAVLRYRLYDLDLLVNRSAVYLATTATMAAVLVAATALFLTDPTGERLSGRLVAASAVLVLLVDPVRRSFQRLLRRRLHGEAADPVRAVTRLRRTLDEGTSTDDLLAAVVTSVAASLRVPYVAVTIDEQPTSRRTYETGRGGVVPTTTVPMVFQGRRIGDLLVAHRSISERFTEAELELLDLLAGQAAIAATAAQLALDLRTSKERLHRDVEEERRKLRHDLHDGVGPVLAGLVMQVGAVASGLRTQHDDSALSGSLATIERGLALCVREVRGVVADLRRPPALDDLGLDGALVEAARSLSSGTCEIEVDIQQLPPLPAAVEVAAYRIATEALTNVVKHADAREARLAVSAAGRDLYVSVADTGVGIADAGRHEGEGLRSITARAAELGGRVSVGPHHPSGTMLEAWLPLEGPAR